MEPLALLDLATRAGCPPAQDRYRLDCLVRWLLANGWEGEPLDVHAGIGRLRVGPGLREWEPATRGTPPPLPLQASPEVRAARLSACVVCDRYRDGRCSVAGCGCAGQGSAATLYSKCPIDRWP